MRYVLCALVLAVAAPAHAQQQFASMTADQAYVRAVEFFQRELAKRDAQAKVGALQAQEAERQRDAALEELKRLRTQADAKDVAAGKALTAFARGEGERGVDVLLADAAADKQQAVAKYKRAGALAYAVDTRRALEAYEEALKLAPGDLAARNQAGHLKKRLGDLAGAAAAYQSVFDGAGGERAWQATALGGLGSIAEIRGDLPAAASFQKRALALNEELGRKDGQAANLSNLGTIAFFGGDYVAAEAYYRRALVINEALGRTVGIATNLNNLGTLAERRSDFAAAEEYLKRALPLYQRLGNQEGVAANFANLGTVLWARGDIAAACENYRKSLALYDRIGAEESRNAGVVRGAVSYCPPKPAP